MLLFWSQLHQRWPGLPLPLRAWVKGLEEGGRGGGGESKVWKRQLYVSPALCGFTTKKRIVDSELTHSSDLPGSLHPLALSVFLQHHSSPLMFICLFLHQINVYNIQHMLRTAKKWRYVCKANVKDPHTHTHTRSRWCIIPNLNVLQLSTIFFLYIFVMFLWIF